MKWEMIRVNKNIVRVYLIRFLSILQLLQITNVMYIYVCMYIVHMCIYIDYVQKWERNRKSLIDWKYIVAKRDS